MRNTAIAAAAALCLISTPALAQRAPAPGMWAVSGVVGVSVPTDAGLDKGLDLAGSLEGYATSRVSFRAQLGASWWDIVNRGFAGTVKPVRIDGNIIYNWEGGAIHPYVTAGVGLYRYQSSIPGAPDAHDTKGGFNVGGGIEYFFARDATILGEALYHKVGAFDTAVTTFGDGSFWSLDIGLKAYFGR